MRAGAYCGTTWGDVVSRVYGEAAGNGTKYFILKPAPCAAVAAAITGGTSVVEGVTDTYAVEAVSVEGTVDCTFYVYPLP